MAGFRRAFLVPDQAQAPPTRTEQLDTITSSDESVAFCLESAIWMPTGGAQLVFVVGGLRDAKNTSCPYYLNPPLSKMATRFLFFFSLKDGYHILLLHQSTHHNTTKDIK